MTRLPRQTIRDTVHLSEIRTKAIGQPFYICVPRKYVPIRYMCPFFGYTPLERLSNTAPTIQSFVDLTLPLLLLLSNERLGTHF